MYATTSGVIAIENLDWEIAQGRYEAGVEELLLARSRFLADYEALERATIIGEDSLANGSDLLRRARTRSAVHRFADALSDIATAERAGANREEAGALRATILIATGRAEEVVSQLEAAVARRPGFASRSALAGAYATLGRLDEADRLYVKAVADLETTSPFPYAWAYFARAVMWTEDGADSARGAALYARALVYLPDFAAASIHLAELEVARGDIASAMTRLERVVASTEEPEALGLLGTLHLRAGDTARGRGEVSRARRRYETLLSRQPRAFADHAAEFYLGPGADSERAWALARQNVVNRPTRRAVALALRAAGATGRDCDVCTPGQRAAVTRAGIRRWTEGASTW
jgi:tetratricopeptide (TPR) repeat protein